MFGIYLTNPDESLCASIAWTLWTQGRLATDLLAGALPGIEHRVYWTPPFYYLVLAPWQGLWGPGLLAVRSLSLMLAVAVMLLLWLRRRRVGPAAWTASVLVVFDPMFQRAASMGRMDMLAICLTVAALVVIEGGATRRRAVVAGGLAAAAVLTHPLGAAAVVAVAVTCARGGRVAFGGFVLGAAPPLLAWLLFIGLDVETFVAQMRLQLAVKAARATSPLDNLRRLAMFHGAHTPIALAAAAGAVAGIGLDRRRLFPWLVGAACLLPVVVLSGELVYPAYLAPFTAVGLSALLSRTRLGRRAVAGLALAAAVYVAADPPPLAGIDPQYDSWCDYVGAHLGPGETALLAIVPDPWFGLRQRTDLRLRLAPPVPIPRERLDAYLRRADAVVFGGYNPLGFRAVVDEWDELSTAGQRLWILHRGRLVDYDDVRDDVRIRW